MDMSLSNIDKELNIIQEKFEQTIDDARNAVHGKIYYEAVQELKRQEGRLNDE